MATTVSPNAMKNVHMNPSMDSMVSVMGLEPMTLKLKVSCATNCAKRTYSE